MVSALVSLAIYVSGGKLIIGALPQFKADIEQVLSQQLPGRVSFATISGNMDGFSPRLSITQFALQDETNQEWVRFPEVSLRIDPWESLTSGALRFDELTLIAPRIEWSDQGAAKHRRSRLAHKACSIVSLDCEFATRNFFAVLS